MSESRPTFVFLCKKWHSLRVSFKKAKKMIVDQSVVSEPELYLMFRQTPIGGIFETHSEEEAQHIRETPQFDEGVIVELDKQALVEALEEAPTATQDDIVTQGAIGTGPRSESKPAPKAPASEPPSRPSAAKAPRKPVAA